MNTVPCTIESGGANPRVKPENGASTKVIAMIPESAKGMKGTFGARPEDLTLTSGDDAIFKGTVDIVEHLGEVTLLYVDCGDPEEPVVAKLDGNVAVEKGAVVGLTAETAKLHVFDDKGQAFPNQNA
jgi:ABC-type sugar transport system ATPase subunit